MAEPQGFHILSEKILHHAANPGLITYCPSMDLVALVTADQQVLIYRLNGQRVFGAIQRASNLRVESIRWKPNGQLLAIAWSDGSVRIVSAESSKTVLQFSTGEGVGGVTCMGWATNLIRRAGSSSSRTGTGSWETFLSSNREFLDEKAPLDLPQDLSLIDIETSLPKLSVLAAGGNSDDVFSSRLSLDALFRPFDPKDDNFVNVMVVGTREGNIHLSIYDSFELGTFVSPINIDGAPCQLIRHASSGQLSTHALLMEPPSSTGSLYFVPMDLRFISVSSDYLSLFASRSTALNNLLRYIHQVQILMVGEWKATQDLPSKFLRNINETLEEKDDRNIIQALYHSVATGHTLPTVREWLVDELSERGHKRWDKAVTTGLENLRRLVHENMLPALERCSIILSRLLGIVKFQGSNSSMGFTTRQINLIMDTIACLHLVCSKILIQVIDDLELFASFSTWLRFEIDKLASNSSASPNEDTAEKESSIDHSKVLLYLQTSLKSSPLALYFNDSPSEDQKDNWSHSTYGLPMFDLLDSQIQNQEKGRPHIKPLPRVDLLCNYLDEQARVIFGQIAEAEKRNVLFGKPQSIGFVEDGGPMDMRMRKIEGHLCQTHVAFVPKGSPSIVQVVRILLSIENGVSSAHSSTSSAVHLGDGQIRDIKFSDDSVLFVLWELNGTTKLLSIPYDAIPGTGMMQGENYRMEYSPQFHPTPAKLSNDEVVGFFSRHRLPGDSAFLPEKMEVRERSSKNSEDESRRLYEGTQGRGYIDVVIAIRLTNNPSSPAGILMQRHCASQWESFAGHLAR
ncbi:uncharacterized protein L3040_007202 [Drepanopeziza brunnea f. sp. 'multigermtubi']|uniref:uncharacterized protein n=1 Tax=Drepanopeziza brunnea f. sp. 'multigermtubi' TaxID=698441 RepID=UPI00238962C5|nr:hypothetical protein L3040_007202 [Drepanopeziza brunnea f. sp. 'multigermtubi']